MVILSNQFLQGDALAMLKTLPAESVQCCITSPPYWSLRDYGDEGQIGLEETPEQYVQKLVEVFREVRRVLKNDGVLWLNLGDSYAGGGPHHGSNNLGKSGTNRGSHTGVDKLIALPAKNLVGIPWRVAFALQQPYEKPHLISKAVDRAWLAALVDGEGCIGIRRFVAHSNASDNPRCQDSFSVLLSIGNNDRELLDKCVEIASYGKVGVKDRPSVDSRGINSRRVYYGWRLDGNKAIDVIQEIYPYLVAKRKQAILAYNLALSNKNGRELRGNGALPQSEQEKREYLKELINQCNQRQQVDIPSWCIDIPPSVIEPGWILRADVIWHKPNAMPESVQDRPTKSHEYLFLLAKNERYYYDADAIRETHTARARKPGGFKPEKATGPNNRGGHSQWERRRTIEESYSISGRNRRSVWSIATKPYPGAHFAVMPQRLVEPCVLSSSQPDDVILDPFSGAGTTALVALKLGRQYLGIELNRDYIALAEQRIEVVQPVIWEASA